MNKRLDFRSKVFKYINGTNIVFQDDMVIVLKSHLLFEFLIDQMLAPLVVDQIFYSDLKLTFSRKIRMLEKRKIISKDLIKIVEQVNNIRNVFAHDLDATFKDVDSSLNKILSICLKRASNRDVFDKVSDNPKALFATCSTYCLAQMATYIIESAKKEDS